MFNNKKILLFLIALLIQNISKAELTIRITQGVGKLTPVAIVPFGNDESSANLSKEITEIISNDLLRNFINKNCVDMKKINGKVSYTIEGEVRNVKKRGNNKFVSVSLK